MSSGMTQSWERDLADVEVDLSRRKHVDLVLGTQRTDTSRNSPTATTQDDWRGWEVLMGWVRWPAVSRVSASCP